MVESVFTSKLSLAAPAFTKKLPVEPLKQELGSRDRVRVVSLDADVCDHKSAVERVAALAERREGAYMCFGTVHMIMESHDSPKFGAKVKIVQDGQPHMIDLLDPVEPQF